MADKPTRVISANDMHVITSQFLSAAESIHTAMCRVGDDHPVQEFLNMAMHHALTGAEQCRQLHLSEKKQIAVPRDETPANAD